MKNRSSTGCREPSDQSTPNNPRGAHKLAHHLFFQALLPPSTLSSSSPGAELFPSNQIPPPATKHLLYSPRCYRRGLAPCTRSGSTYKLGWPGAAGWNQAPSCPKQLLWAITGMPRSAASLLLIGISSGSLFPAQPQAFVSSWLEVSCSYQQQVFVPGEGKISKSGKQLVNCRNNQLRGNFIISNQLTCT